MQPSERTMQPTSKMLWVGRIMSALPAVAILFAAVVKLTKAAPVVQGFAQFGFTERMVVPIGLIELVCAVIYLIPQTAVLGAILMTGLLGGATVTNMRVGDPSSIVTVTLGVLVWGGLFLREKRLQALIPIRR
jgi:hypothetical protein